MANHTIEATDYQIEALNTKSTNTLLLGGIGTGKSFIGALWVITKARLYYRKKDKKGRGLRFIICANTYTQLIQASVETLIMMLEMFGIKYKATLSGAKKRVTFLGCTCYLYSLEKYDNIRGIEVDYVWVDEGCFAKAQAYKVLKGRMRAVLCKFPQILITSSPNGFNWVYDMFEGKDNDDAEDFDTIRLIRAKTIENTHLRDGYYEELLRDYGGEDSPLARQELFGEFVSLTEGSIYWGFDRKKSVKALILNKNYPVYVGVDFNVDNMNAVYMQFIKGILYCVEEVSITYTNSGTYELCGRILKDLQGYQVFCIPDSTGKSRSPSSYNSESNLQIMRDAGLRLLDTRNPAVRSRQTTVNRHFVNEELVMDPSCIKTMKELETLNGREKEGLVSHLAVCLGYVCWKLNPVRTRQERAKQFNV